MSLRHRTCLGCCMGSLFPFCIRGIFFADYHCKSRKMVNHDEVFSIVSFMIYELNVDLWYSSGIFTFPWLPQGTGSEMNAVVYGASQFVPNISIWAHHQTCSCVSQKSSGITLIEEYVLLIHEFAVDGIHGNRMYSNCVLQIKTRDWNLKIWNFWSMVWSTYIGNNRLHGQWWSHMKCACIKRPFLHIHVQCRSLASWHSTAKSTSIGNIAGNIWKALHNTGFPWLINIHRI